MSQAVRICKKKKTHNGKFVDIKVHLYSKSRLVTINGVLNYIIKSVQAIPSNAYSTSKFPQMHTVQAIPSIHSTSYSLKKKKKRGMEEKVVDFKKRRGGGKTKEKDIMKRRQEGGEEEKKMGTEERERRRSR